MLKPQIGCNIEAYVDNLVVKSRFKGSLLSNLGRTFNNLYHTHMRLNPEKCMFGMAARKLLGFLVSQRGFEANPNEVAHVAKGFSKANKLPNSLK